MDRAPRQLWSRYDEMLAGLPLETPPPAEPHTRHARHLYQVRVESSSPLSRDKLLDGLTAHSIGAGVHYRGVHLHPYYRDKYGLSPGDFPVASSISERTLSLPLSHTLSEADVENVVDALRRALGGERRRIDAIEWLKQRPNDRHV